MSEMSATWKAALWVGVVFLLGAALGGVVGYSYEHHLVSAANTPLPEPARRAQRVEQAHPGVEPDERIRVNRWTQSCWSATPK